ncbi:PIN_Mut7-C-like domain containing protein [Fimbriimonadaceae bacterium]
MTLVFDENISSRLVELLAKCGAPKEIQHLRKLGWQGMADHVWIPQAIEMGWIIVTADRNEVTRRLSSKTIKDAEGRIIFLGQFWNSLESWEMTKWLVANYDRIHAEASLMNGGDAVLFNQTGPPNRL